jgi:hypothetical protein
MREVWMFCQFLHPRVRFQDRFLLGIIFVDGKPIGMSLSDYVGHILPTKSSQDAEEESPLRQLVRKLPLRWKIFTKDIVLHGVLVYILNRDLAIVRHFKMYYLVCLEVKL